MTFEEAYGEYGHQLLRWTIHRFGPEMADDVLQEGLLQAWKHWQQPGFTPDNVKPWLFGVVKYAGLHMLRAGRTLSSREGEVAPFWGRNADNSAELNPDMKLPPNTPTQGLAVYVAQLRHHFGCLGPAQQEALLALAEGETAQEFADRTGRSQQAVSAAVQLGRKRIRERLGDSEPHVWGLTV